MLQLQLGLGNQAAAFIVGLAQVTLGWDHTSAYLGSRMHLVLP